MSFTGWRNCIASLCLEKIGGKKLGVWIFGFVFLFISPPLFAESAIWVDPSTGRITVKATREQIKELEKILPELPVQTRQIQIEARIIEVTTQITKKFGTYLERLTGLEVKGTPGEGSTLTYGPKTLADLSQGLGALSFTFYRITNEEKFEAIINMLLSRGRARVLSAPRVVTLSGEVAGIYVTTEVPYLSSITYRVVDNKEIPEEHYSYATVGVVLQVLPRIVGEDLVEMSVIPLVGDYQITAEFGAQHPIFKRQVSPTNVTVKDGETLVIGGLISRKKSKQIIGLPVVSHLPIVGNIFKSRVETIEEKNLIITIKPHILKPREIKGRVKKIFHLKYALAGEVAIQVKKLLSPDGSVEVNPKEAPPNSILVRDREDKMNVIQSLLNKIGTFKSQRRQKVYKLSYTDVEDARKVIKSFLSPNGSVKVDREKNTLIVEDGAYQISLVDSAISVLEQYNSQLHREQFKLKVIPAGEAVKKIRTFLSPQGTVESIDEKTILIDDNSLVINKVRKYLAEFDTFERQKEIVTYPLKYILVSQLLKSEDFKQRLKEKLSSQGKFEMREETNELVITEVKWKQEEIKKLISGFDRPQPTRITLPVRFALASSVEPFLSEFLSPQGQIQVDVAKNSLIIKDSPYPLKLMKEELSRIDTFDNVKIRVRLAVSYMPLDQAIKMVKKGMSEKGKIIKVDLDKRSFVVEDAPYPISKIKNKLSELDTFEKQSISKFYKLNYISAENACDAVKYFLSPQGKVYPFAEEILVIDAPYYQDKVKRILSVIDVPYNTSDKGE